MNEVQRPSYEETERLLREAIAASKPRPAGRPSPRATAVLPAQLPVTGPVPVEDDTPTDPDLAAEADRLSPPPPVSDSSETVVKRSAPPVSRPAAKPASRARPRPLATPVSRPAATPASEPADADAAMSSAMEAPASQSMPESMPETGARLRSTEDIGEHLPPTAHSNRSDLRNRPWPVVAAAGAVVLVVAIGGYLGLNSAPDDGKGVSRTSEVSPPASSPSQASGSPSGETSPSASPSDDSGPSPSDSPPPSPTATTAALPDGWKMHKDKMGFSIGLPRGWDEYKREGDRVYFRGPGAASNAFVMVEEASNPGSDPYKDWKKQEPRMKYNFGGYKLIDIKKVDYQKAAADWDFTWNTNTGKTRVRNRGFITTNGRAYAIYWHNLNSRWKKDYHFFETFCATFQPAK
jgi:hypothetical protein